MNEEEMYQDLMKNSRNKVYRYMKIRNIKSSSNSTILSDILKTQEGRDILYTDHWEIFAIRHKYRGPETPKGFGSIIVTNATQALAEKGKLIEERAPELKYSFIELNQDELKEW